MSSDQLIFISGWAADASCWDVVIERIDRPVSCCHVNWWECLNLNGEKNALLGVLDHEMGNAIIVAWSLGALTALEGFLFRPNRVKAMVLISGTSRMTSHGKYPGVDSRALRAMCTGFRRNPRRVLTEFASRCIDGGSASSVETEAFIDKFTDQAGRIGTGRLAAGLRYLQQTDLRGILPKVNIPVRLLHGDRDRIIPVECARYMQSRIPGARLVEVQDGSHALLHTVPFRVAGFIRGAIDANYDSQ